MASLPRQPDRQAIPRTHAPFARRGLSLLELIAAGVLLAVVGGSLLPVFSRLDTAHQNNRQRQRALIELENLLERATPIPFKDVSVQRLAALAEATQLKQRLPGTKLEIVVQDVAGTPPSRQVRYRLLSDSPQPGRELAALNQWFFSQEKP